MSGDSSSEEGDDLFYQQAVFVDEFGGDTLAFEHETVAADDPFEADRAAALAATTSTTMTTTMRQTICHLKR
jgi:hypothetical protein